MDKKPPRSAGSRSARPAPSKKPRRPGRPSGATGSDERGRILDLAIALFGERGIAATSLRAIAQQAGVTPALLHYYFDSKESLVETMIQERIAPFVAVSVQPLLTPSKSPRATLMRFLEIHMRNIAAHPWMPRLMAREVLSDGGMLRGQMQAQFSSALSPKTLMLIVAAQRSGEIRDDLNPVLLGISLIALAVFPFAAAPVWRSMMQTIFQGLPEEVESRVKQTMTVASPRAWGDASAEALIEHTLAVVDSLLDPPPPKRKP